MPTLDLPTQLPVPSARPQNHHPTYFLLSFMLLQAYVKVVGYLDGAFQIKLDKKETLNAR